MFTSVFCCSGIISGVLVGSERILRFCYGFLTFRGVLRNSVTFLLVLSLSESILNVLPLFLTVLGVLRLYEVF